MIDFVPSGGCTLAEEEVALEVSSSWESEAEVYDMWLFLVPGGVAVAVAIAADVDFTPSEEASSMPGGLMGDRTCDEYVRVSLYCCAVR